MRDAIVARRYAKALFSLALDEGDVARYGKELERMHAAMSQVPLLAKALADENVPFEKREKVVGALAAPLGFSPSTVNFLKLLVEKERIAIFSAVVQNYRRMQLELERIASAELTVADRVIVDEAADRIRDLWEGLLGRRGICDVKVDEDLIGGFIVRVGDTVFDASVKGRLQRMKERMLHH